MRRFNAYGFTFRFNQALEESGLTMGQLHAKTGISMTAIEYYKRGKALPNSKNLFLVCEALHVTSDWLLGLEGI